MTDATILLCPTCGHVGTDPPYLLDIIIESADLVALVQEAYRGGPQS